MPPLITLAQEKIIELSEKAVARDIIEVNVSGPDFVDLTLVDLPGIVRTLGTDDDEDLVQDIKTLIDDYITNERCVVLAVVPANVDFHNSQILADAKTHDPTTRRTIPVITKPDLIDKGAEGGVLDLLLGNSMDAFAMGFHMVKCRGQADLNQSISMAKGLKDEASYFASTQPWKKKVDEGKDDLFGIPALRIKLSNIQLRMIKDSIPGIIKEVQEKLGKAEKTINLLGVPISTDYERRSCFRKFTRDALKVLNDAQVGLASHANLFAENKKRSHVAVQQEAYNTFGKNVMAKKLASISNLEIGTKVIVQLSDGTEEHGTIKAVSDDKTEVHVRPGDLSFEKHKGLLEDNIKITSDKEWKVGQKLSCYMKIAQTAALNLKILRVALLWSIKVKNWVNIKGNL